MTSVAFSGVTELKDGQQSLVARKARIHVNRQTNDHFITGAADGIDTLCFYLAFAWRRQADHTIIVPNGKYNKDVVQFARAMDLEVKEMPDGTNHLDRNDKVIEIADILVAFPGGSDELWRGSGTWSTIRRARKKGIPIYIYPLNGDRPWKENTK